MTRPRLIFITGTDTGVGKTLLTSLLLHHLRERGIHALALKPFCSGSRGDVTLLRSLMDRELTLDEINPFYFPEPVAPLVAARKHRRHISLHQVLSHVSRITHHVLNIAPNAPRSQAPALSRSNAPTLLIEGAGGLLAPLAANCTALEIINRLGCEVIVVAFNKLGTINHTLLTLQSLKHFSPEPSARACALLHPVRSTKVVLMGCGSSDPSARSNPRILGELLGHVPLVHIPFLGRHCQTAKAVRKHASHLRLRLRRILL